MNGKMQGPPSGALWSDMELAVESLSRGGPSSPSHCSSQFFKENLRAETLALSGLSNEQMESGKGPTLSRRKRQQE